jgi:hypothetical protein
MPVLTLSACKCKSCSLRQRRQEVASPFFHLEGPRRAFLQPPGGVCGRSALSALLARENASYKLGNGGRSALNIWLNASQGAEYVCVPEISAPFWCLPPRAFDTASRPFFGFRARRLRPLDSAQSEARGKQGANNVCIRYDDKLELELILQTHFT